MLNEAATVPRTKTDTVNRYPELEAFLDHLRLERGLSQNTCSSYRLDLVDFFQFLEIREIKPVAVSLAEGQQYATELHHRQMKNSTTARRISALRSFYNYLTLAAIIPDNPLILLSGPKLHRSLPHILAVEDVIRLIEAPDTSTPIGLRDRAMWELMYAAGLRVSETAGLEFGDVDFTESWLLIRGKGDKERWAPMGRSAREWLERYLREGHPLLQTPGQSVRKMFLNKRGAPLTRQGIWYLLKGYAARLSPPLDLHPHTLRHCCATHLLEGGADLRTIQEFLGHADISTTQIYTQVDRSYLQEVHRTYHPRG